MGRNPKYPYSAAVAQAEWLARHLGPGWEPHVELALVNRGSSTTDPRRWTFWAQRGPIKILPEQVYQNEEHEDHDLALLAAEALHYRCVIQHDRGAWPRFGIPLTSTRDPREALRSHLAALSEQIVDHQNMLTKALVALQETPNAAKV